MKKAIVIGATSGIGRALAVVLARNGYQLGITGRRAPLLKELQAELPGRNWDLEMDLQDLPATVDKVQGLIEKMGGVDLVVISAGTGFIDPELLWEREKEMIDVNVLGFAAIANLAYRHFVQRGSGHLVGISSISAIRGGTAAPAYNASKAFVSNYLQGLRFRLSESGLPITVTDIKPGFVDTAMAKGGGQFWVASPEKAAGQIYDAIRKRRNHAYITKRWRLVAWIMKIVPEAVYGRII